MSRNTAFRPSIYDWAILAFLVGFLLFVRAIPYLKPEDFSRTTFMLLMGGMTLLMVYFGWSAHKLPEYGRLPRPLWFCHLPTFLAVGLSLSAVLWSP